MLGSLLRQLGVSPAAIETGIGAADQLRCEVVDLRRALQLEYGRPSCELMPHNPAQVPEFHYEALTAETPVVYDAEAALGKSSTRGHVSNIGDAELVVQFVGMAGDQWSGDYHLPAGGVLDTSSFSWRKVRLRAVDSDGRAQIMAQ